MRHRSAVTSPRKIQSINVNDREALWLAHQRKRWMLPDPSRWLQPDQSKWMRPDAHRWMQPNQKLYLGPQPHERKDEQGPVADIDELLRLKSELEALQAEIKFRRLLRTIKAYNPNQPRVPAGSPDGGEWTAGGGTSGGAGRNDPRVISDATPDNEWKPGAQYAQNRPGRGLVPVRINGRLVDAEPGQAARLAVAEARAQDAIRQVREVDPNWRPSPSAYGTGVESEIQKANDLAVEAQARVNELARVGVGPGPFAGESIPARGPERDFNILERLQNRKNFSATGCHTCGTFDAGTIYGDPVLDHQPPTGLNYSGAAQRLYPQCLTCSLRQGNWIMRYKRVRNDE